MKCIRCGYCCVAFDVVIVKPEFVDNVDLTDVSCMKKLIHKHGNQNCPHLEYDNETRIATCKVHNKSWYKDSPCYSHHVIGDPNKPCRVGDYQLKNGWKIKEDYRNGKERCGSN